MHDGLLIMLETLESHQLQVILVPLNPSRRGYNEGGCKRVKADQNAKWYRDLCAAHPSSRGTRRGGFDTRIRRQGILRILRRLCAGQLSVSKYADELRSIARKLAA